MDLSSAGGALIVTILRLLHIVGGLVWVARRSSCLFTLSRCWQKPALMGGASPGDFIARQVFPA